MLLQVKRTSAKAPHRQTSDDDSGSNGNSSDSDNILEDYLANLQCDSDDSNSYEQQVFCCFQFGDRVQSSNCAGNSTVKCVNSACCRSSISWSSSLLHASATRLQLKVCKKQHKVG